MKRCFACEARFEAADWTCPACGSAPAIRGGFLAFAPELVDGSGEDAEYTYDEMAAAEAKHFWFVSRSRLIVWALQRYFPQARTLLEVGCGTGGVASAIRVAFPRLDITATEVLVRGLAFAARKLPGVSLLQMDAHRIPFDAEFDVIAAFDVIEHIDDDRGVLRAMYEGIAPGGGVVITVPQHQALWSPIDDFGRHRRRYARRELEEKLRDAGFAVVRMTSFLSLLLPLLFAARWRLRSFDPKVDSELRVSPVLNGLLTGICSLERFFIRMGVSWPAGGSLLAVAVRRR